MDVAVKVEYNFGFLHLSNPDHVIQFPSKDWMTSSVILFRNIQFFGMESQRKVSESFVVVIGLGGVGSHAASMLLRSGIGRLRLVDFDQV